MIFHDFELKMGKKIFTLWPVLANNVIGFVKVRIFLDCKLSCDFKKPNFGLERWKLKIF